MATELKINEQKLANFVRLNPGCTIAEVALMLEKPNSTAHYELTKLMKLGYLRREQTYSENNHKAYRFYLGGTVKVESAENIEDKGKPSLDGFTPRELMMELKKRGYTGKLRLVTVKEVDFERL